MQQARQELKEMLPAHFHDYIPESVPDEYDHMAEKVGYALSVTLIECFVQEHNISREKAAKMTESALEQGAKDVFFAQEMEDELGMDFQSTLS